MLISGDALWEQRLAVQFPALVGSGAFDLTLSNLELIEELAPRLVIPGHGAPFQDVGAALQASRQRVLRFRDQPASHARYAARALVAFHLMERDASQEETLLQWMQGAQVFRDIADRCGVAPDAHALVDWARELLAEMVATDVLVRDAGGVLRMHR